MITVLAIALALYIGLVAYGLLSMQQARHFSVVYPPPTAHQWLRRNLPLALLLPLGLLLALAYAIFIAPFTDRRHPANKGEYQAG